MSSSDQYQAIPAGEPAERFHSTLSGGRKKLMYAVGAILLVLGVVVVTAHASTDQYHEFTPGSPYLTKLAPGAYAPRFFNYERQLSPVSVDHLGEYGFHARHHIDSEQDRFMEYTKMRPSSIDHVPGYALHSRHHGGHHDYGVGRDRPFFGREYYRRFDRMMQ
ncbi:hypothetical protein FGB62_37g115 [Gracilaria domingensis]|nr:hypothetical protein FGB62_37g115 [Gracilaria domingensis]